MQRQNVNNLKHYVLFKILILILISVFTASCSNTQSKSDKKEVAKSSVEAEKKTTNTQAETKTSESSVETEKKTTDIQVAAKNSESLAGVKKKTTNTQTTAKTSHFIFGTIKSLNKDTRVMGFDDLELITADQKERMKQIGITDKDFSNWYLYNASNKIESYKIKDNASITIYSKENGNKISTDINGLYKQFANGYENHYDMKVQGDYIVEIVQKILNE